MPFPFVEIQACIYEDNSTHYTMANKCDHCNAMNCPFLLLKFKHAFMKIAAHIMHWQTNVIIVMQ